MLLVIDVGNTNTVLGIYDGEHLVDNWRVWTERDRTSDEYGILMRNLFSSRSIPLEKIKAISIQNTLRGFDVDNGVRACPWTINGYRKH